MADLANTFEGGSDETTISAANSGGASGNAFNSIYSPGSSTLKFDTAKALVGSYSLRLDNNNAASIVTWTSASTGGGFTESWGRVYLWLSGFNPQRFAHIENTATNRAAAFDILGSGKLRILDGSGAVTDSTSNVLTSEWMRVEWHIVHSATVGQVDVEFFSGHSTSAIESFSTPATRNTLASADNMVIGQYLTNATVYSSWFDDVAFSTTDWIGPSVSAGLLLPQRLSGPALLTNSAATIYTSVGDSLIQVVSVSNPSGSPVNLTMSVGADAAGTRLFDAFPIPAGTQRDFRMHQPLTNGQIIQAFGSTTGVLNVTLNGRDD